LNPDNSFGQLGTLIVIAKDSNKAGRANFNKNKECHKRCPIGVNYHTFAPTDTEVTNLNQNKDATDEYQIDTTKNKIEKLDTDKPDTRNSKFRADSKNTNKIIGKKMMKKKILGGVWQNSQKTLFKQ
jgi:hypothetical protein